jgi:hypothetical protein
MAAFGRYVELFITAIMHRAQLCAVMLGDSDKNRTGIGFSPFGLPLICT